MKLLIMAGGTGARLWPLSRIYFPKQFVKFQVVGNSTFQQTVEKALTYFKSEDVFIVTNNEYKYFVYGQLKEIGISIPKENIIFEADFKNTFHAATMGIYYMSSRLHDDEDILIVPSNNLVDNLNNVIALEDIAKCKRLVKKNFVLFGVASTGPVAGYGYIKEGENDEIENYIEKVDAVEAGKCIQGGYLCNSGVVLVRSNVYKDAVKRLYPELHELFETGDYAGAYNYPMTVTIEHGLIEKIKNISAVKVKPEWLNINEFSCFFGKYEETTDKDNNIYFNDSTIFLDSNNNMIYAETDKAIGCIGVNNLVVMDQPDALLICDRRDVGKVRLITEKLRESGDKRAEYHTTVYRPWGSYTVLEDLQGYKIKRITVFPGKKLSYQLHHKRSEHWVVVSGVATVVKEGIEHQVKAGESIFISIEEKHRLENREKEKLEVIEVQIGSYLEEDDIVRFEDDYGRGNGK